MKGADFEVGGGQLYAALIEWDLEQIGGMGVMLLAQAESRDYHLFKFA